jgi:hypothetical protein
MIRLLIAGGVGYIFGARAGRARYEQLLALSKSIRANPLVAEAISAARKQAGDALGAKQNKQEAAGGQSG